jgi:hypothetical protein
LGALAIFSPLLLPSRSARSGFSPAPKRPLLPRFSRFALRRAVSISTKIPPNFGKQHKPRLLNVEKLPLVTSLAFLYTKY